MINIKEKIVIFDGICGLCNKSIDLLIKLDTHKIFQYTSLQGEFVKTLNIEPNIDSIIFYDEGRIYYTNIFYLIPRSIRDFIYDVIAKYRYKIFGMMQSCRVPNESEEKLFID